MHIEQNEAGDHVITFISGRRTLILTVNSKVEYQKVSENHDKENDIETGRIHDSFHIMELIGWVSYTR